MKTKRFLSIILTVCMVLSLLPVGTLATEDAPQLVDGYYEIYNADQLYWFAEQVNSGNNAINGKLMADIVVNENVLDSDGMPNSGNFRTWTPIGVFLSWEYDDVDTDICIEYVGVFDGNGKTISGLCIQSGGCRIGLFGTVGQNGVVKNLGVIDSYFNGYGDVGGIAGYNAGELSCCYNTGTVCSFEFTSGGVVGTNYGTVSNCYNLGYVTGFMMVGGVVGYLIDGTLTNSFNRGTVSGVMDVGGLVGYWTGGTISDCYNAGYTSNEDGKGGFVGTVDTDSTAENSYLLSGTCYNYTGAVAKTAEQFASGEVAYLLGAAFGQQLGADDFPVVGGPKVYYNVVGGCTDATYIYAYENESKTVYTHAWTDATCTNAKTCTVCGAVEGAALGHSWTEATCTEAQVCTLCGAEIPALGHSWTEATCTEAQVCTLCGAEVSAPGHSWKEASCTEAQVCTVCGAEVPAPGHSWMEATCTVAKTCSLCGATEGSALGHGENIDGFCSVCGGAFPPPLNGDVYEISNADQLYWFAEQVNSGNDSINGKLMADIVVNENVLNADGTLNGDGSNFRVWIPIGYFNSYDDNAEYTGHFDGNGKTVSGLYFNDTSKDYVGLFGQMMSGGVVKNVGVVASYFSGNEYVGSVVGYAFDGDISNCYNTGTVSGGESVGGVVGQNYFGTVRNCYNTGNVSGTDYYVGGVVGRNNSGIVSYCYNTGTVSGNKYAGGVVGKNSDGTISNCYNTGNISGNEYVGGVVGDNDQDTVSNSYNTGSVSGSKYVGGVVGHNRGDVTDSYNMGSVSGTGDYVGGIAGHCYGDVINSYNTGTVSGKNDVGGVAGCNEGTVKNNYNTGSVKGSWYVGGVVGYNNDTIRNCYNTGSVSGSSYVGGVLGRNNKVDSRNVVNCYYLSGCASNNGYGIAKTATQFASGEVAYLLRGKQEDSPWGQRIGTDAAPVLGQSWVYLCCDGESDVWYSNDAEYVSNHNYINGFCPVCNEYQSAALNGDVYEVFNVGQLYWVAEYVNAGNNGINIKLMADIVVNENVLNADGTLNGDGSNFRAWTPIGYYNSYDDNAEFTGNFDGNGKTVSGLYFKNTSKNYVGLFGYVGSSGKVQNVGVVGSYFGGGKYVGGVAGENYGTVTNSYNTGTVSGSEYVGGVAGENYGTMTNSYNIGSVTGSERVGGVVGYNSYGTVSNSYNTGTVSGGESVGGVVGYNSYGTVSNCYNTGTVSGGESVGGMVGYNYGTVSNSYNTGSVSGSEYVGGVVGDNDYGIASNSYNMGTISGSERVGGVVGCNSSTVRNCYNRGSVGDGKYVGGVVGYNSDTVGNVYNTGSVSGSGDYVGGVVGDNSSGTLSNGYYLIDCVSNGNSDGTAKTAAQFASGEVAYLLRDDPLLHIWGQKIGTDPLPIFSQDLVYKDGDAYTNCPEHSYENGYCSCCGFTEAPALNENVYEISNVGQLYWFAAEVNGGNTFVNGKLMADIVVNENVLNADGTLNGEGSNFRVWTPIGNETGRYSGTFDGNGKTISGLYFNDTSKSYIGLFGSVGGVVQNVGVLDSYFSGENCVGGVVGSNAGTVTNSYNTGTVNGSENVGGVVGLNGGTVTNSYNTGSVSGVKSVGGVVGYVQFYRTVTNCYNTGSVSGTDYYVGGVVGKKGGSFGDDGGVTNCYNTGSVSGNRDFVGGVVGYISHGIVSNSYNAGTVSGSGDYVGGVVGYTTYNGATNCYNTGSVNGSKYVGGVVGYGVYGVASGRNLYNTGCVSGSECVGGVLGYYFDFYVTNCYNTGTVNGSKCVGGVSGFCNMSGMSNCYNTGSVSGNTYVGGVMGRIRDERTIENCYYLTGCAVDGDGVVQNGIGCETQGSVTEDVEGSTTAKTVEQFASGEVCWLLSGGPTSVITKKNDDDSPWGQEIGKEKFPGFSENEVYCITDDQGNVLGYSNVEGELPVLGVTISGNVTSFLEGDVTVELVQDGKVVYSTTATDGSYVFEGVMAGDYTLRVTKANHIPVEMAITIGDEDVAQDAKICPTGDVTGDGVVNIKDFQRLLRHVNKTNPLTDYELACGDVTGDGVCNIKDFQRLLRHVNKTNPLF